ncbi:HTH tetR-type domain-containing protein [Flavobacterium longum]|uniref:TetR/AcrR family transcriptional regulator n=1 Tax=Flavobacterium longum TaxID=1299340 RepID=UPI0039EACCBD
MKDKIIDKAAELFLTVGFKSITMDDIAAKMGISKKTLYKYFSNKEQLVDETTMSFQQRINARIDDVLAKDYNPIKELFEIKKTIQTFFQITDTSPLYQLKKHYPETHDKLMDCEQKECAQLFGQNISRGIAQGLYRKETDIETCTFFYYALIMHINATTILEKDASKLELALLEYHIRAIATPKGIAELEQQLATLNEIKSI